MNTKLWVSISLVIFLVLLANIFAFGLLKKYSSGDNPNRTIVTIITNKKSTSVVNKTIATSTLITQNSNPSTTATNPAKKRVTRAS